MKQLIEKWTQALDDLKTTLYVIGRDGDSLRYNLFSSEAMTLSACIIDLQNEMLVQGEASNEFLRSIRQGMTNE